MRGQEEGNTYSPAPEGLLLGIGNLGGEIGHGHGDVGRGGVSQLHLDHSKLVLYTDTFLIERTLENYRISVAI